MISLVSLYSGEYAGYSFINKCCTDIMKKYFDKELVMTKEDDKDFVNSTKCWNCDNVYVEDNVKIRDHCHITGKYRGSAHRDYCNTKVTLNPKIPIVFQDLENYDSHLIMPELGKINFKINVILSELEKYMSFNINIKFIFIDIFQFLSSSLDSLVNSLGENNFNYLNQQLDSKLLDLVKQK